MGWTFACNPNYNKADLIKDLLGPGHRPAGGKLLAHSVVGNNLWTVVEYVKDPCTIVRYIGLDLMQSGKAKGCDPMGWGYKDLCESMGPCEVDCPLYLLDMVEVPKGEYAETWRDLVRAYHAGKSGAKARAAALKPGDIVHYGGYDYRLLRPSKSRLGHANGWMVESVSNGRQYRMRSAQINASTLNPSEPAPVFTKEVTAAEFIASTPGMADLFANAA